MRVEESIKARTRLQSFTRAMCPCLIFFSFWPAIRPSMAVWQGICLWHEFWASTQQDFPQLQFGMSTCMILNPHPPPVHADCRPILCQGTEWSMSYLLEVQQPAF